MASPNWNPTPNYLFVSIPERYLAPKGPRSPEGLALTLLEGDDAMRELDAMIRQGGKVHFETKSERSVQNIVRTGQVLQIPTRLDSSMTFGGGGPKGVRTFADMTAVVEVGDTVHLDHTFLIDENEVYPGVYRVPYSAVICVLDDYFFDGRGRRIKSGIIEPAPVGGYVLLSRVWADDVLYETLDGELIRCRKNSLGLVTQTNVPPLPGEGVVEWVGAPLKGTPDELCPGQRVVFSPKFATLETIAGVEYIAIRQDYILAVREPVATQLEIIPIHHPAYLA